MPSALPGADAVAAPAGYAPLLQDAENGAAGPGAEDVGDESKSNRTPHEEMLSMLITAPEQAVLWVLSRLAAARPGIFRKANAAAAAAAAIQQRPTGVEGVSALPLSFLDRPLADMTTPTGPSTGSARSSDGLKMLSPKGHKVFSPREEASTTVGEDLMDGPPIVQFASFTFFCNEDEGCMKVDIMRIGNISKRSEVSFKTEDISAKHGVTYKSVNCQVVFEPHQDHQSVDVPIITRNTWSELSEFAVVLHEGEQGVTNAMLGRYLYTSRVKVIDNDWFPSDKYAEFIRTDTASEAPPLGLFLEYLKYNWSIPVVRQRSRKCMLIDQLHNVYSFFHLFVNVYLVDYVLKDKHHSLFFVQSKEVSLFLVVAATLGPFACLHWLDHHKGANYGTGGTSRMKLQVALIRRFLNYEQQARCTLRNGDLIMALTRDSVALVHDGYVNALMVVKELGELVFMMMYQFIAPVVFGKQFGWLGFAPLVIFPILMIAFLKWRDKLTSKLLDNRNCGQDSLVSSVDETVNNYRLIADYGQREKFIKHVEGSVQAYNKAAKAAGIVIRNNKYFAHWLGALCVAAWTIGGGHQVVNHRLSMGMFLVNIHIFQKIAKAWDSIYQVFLEISTMFPALENVVHLMNMPMDVNHRKELSNCKRQQSQLMRDKMRRESSTPDLANPDDRMPIMVGNLPFCYATRSSAPRGSAPTTAERVTRLVHKGLLDVRQGQFVCLIGPTGGGKSTLLKILGGEILPDARNVNTELDAVNGQFFVPAHLRVLHVMDCIFFEGTLLQNLCFGLSAHDEDQAMDRVIEVCTKLGVSEDVLRHIKQGDSFMWTEALSTAQCQLLSVARALVTNPEALCMHQPIQVFDAHTARRCMKVVREFVDKKGLVQKGSSGRRRPRTVIITCSDNANVELADEVYHVSRDRGIRRVQQCKELKNTFDAVQGALRVMDTPLQPTVEPPQELPPS